MSQMSIQNLEKLSPEDAREIPMVDLAFAVLKQANNPMYYRDLMQEIARIKGFTEEEAMQVIAQVYTEINIDGRFACVGNNLWGLKRWYPIERSEDAMSSGKHPRIINDEDDDDLDDPTLFGDEADDYSAEDEDFDKLDEDSDELFDEDGEEVDEDLDDEEELDEELADEELDDSLDDEEDDVDYDSGSNEDMNDDDED